MGPDAILVEVWKGLGEFGVMWLTKLFNKIAVTKKIPNDWMKSILIPIYKSKEDFQNYAIIKGLNW